MSTQYHIIRLASSGIVVTTQGEMEKLLLSSVGQADDVGLLANSLKYLNLLLHLTVMYCEKYQVKLVASKTKLLVFSTKDTELKVGIVRSCFFAVNLCVIIGVVICCLIYVTILVIASFHFH